MRIVLTLQLWHQKVGYVQRDIGGIGLHHESWWDCDGIYMGLPCDCNGIESWWDCIEKKLWKFRDL